DMIAPFPPRDCTLQDVATICVADPEVERHALDDRRQSAEFGHACRLALRPSSKLTAKLELARRQRREFREVTPLLGGQASPLMVKDTQDAVLGAAKRYARGEAAGVGGGKLPWVQF